MEIEYSWPRFESRIADHSICFVKIYIVRIWMHTINFQTSESMNESSRIKKETPVKGINNLFEQMFIHTFSTY